MIHMPKPGTAGKNLDKILVRLNCTLLFITFIQVAASLPTSRYIKSDFHRLHAA